MGFINPLFSVCHQKNNARQCFNPNRSLEPLRFCMLLSIQPVFFLKAQWTTSKRIRQARCRHANERRTGSNENNIKTCDKRYNARFGFRHDIANTRCFSRNIVDVWGLSQGTSGYYSPLIPGKVGIRGMFQGITPQISAALHEKWQVFRRFQAGLS